MASADIRKPEEKHVIETNIAQRGPLRSTIVPPNAADTPSITMASWNGSALPVPDSLSEDSSGGLKTLHAYAWPMARWIDSAAGGTSQRLHDGGATVRVLSRKLFWANAFTLVTSGATVLLWAVYGIPI